MDVERAVLTGLVEFLDNPHLVKEYLDVYNAKFVRLATADPQDVTKLQTQRDSLAGELKRVQRALIRGLLDETEADAEIPRLRAEIQAIDRKIAQVGHSAELITLKTKTLRWYQDNADTLLASLAGHIAAGGNRAKPSAELRTLIEVVSIHPSGPRAKFDIEVKGRLDELLRERIGRPTDLCGVAVVARDRYHRSPHGAPLLYRIRSVS